MRRDDGPWEHESGVDLVLTMSVTGASMPSVMSRAASGALPTTTTT